MTGAVEGGRDGLFESPFEEFLEVLMGENGFHVVEGVPEFVVGPAGVDESFTGWTGGDSCFAALAFGDDVVSPGWGTFEFTESARLLGGFFWKSLVFRISFHLSGILRFSSREPW